MEQENIGKRKKGRPKALLSLEVPKTIRLTKIQWELIKSQAQKAEMTFSNYAREMLLNGKVEVFKRNFPKEALRLVATYNSIAANINSLAHRNNLGNFLTETDRNNLREWLKNFRDTTHQLIQYLYNDSSNKESE